MKTADLIDHFMMFLMNEFYQKLENDLERWTNNLLEAVKEDKKENIEHSLSWIHKYRDMMNDLRDENMSQTDFVGLIIEKFGLVKPE